MDRIVRLHGDESGRPADRVAALAAEHAPGAWEWDFRSGQFSSTKRLRDLFGFRDADSRTFDALVDATLPVDRAWANIVSPRLPATASFPAVERFRIRRVDTGEVRWMQARIWRVPGDSARSEAVGGYRGIIEDITAQTETARSLTESEERLRLAIEAGRMAVWEVDLVTGQMTQSAELNVLLGFAVDATPNLRDIRALYAPGEIERLAREGATVEVVREQAFGGAFEPWRKDALTSGADRTQVQAEVAIVTPAGTPKQLMLRAQYAPFPDGRPRLTGLLIDITEKKRAEERLAVVARELQHRVKNSLSVISALAIQSLRHKADDAALQSFLGRVGALSMATDLILQGNSANGDLRDIVEKITSPYRNKAADPFAISGPSIALSANRATAVGMILHELSTNAVKFGSLSVPSGTVSIAWQEQAGAVVLTWQEQNGPPVQAPARRGFGTRLLESVVSRELAGTFVHEFLPGGLLCRIQIKSE
jgi:two-component sensor histidine kinase